jgi:hypothetical protein
MYEEHKAFWPKMFEGKESNMKYEELVAGNTFGLAQAKSDGDKVKFASESQGAVTRAASVLYALGYIITLSEARFNLYEKLGKQRGARLAAAFPRTKDTVATNVYNRAFTSGYTFGDGQVMCSTAHPSMVGNYSNTLSVAADLSEASLEDVLVAIASATDNVGNKINLQAKSLMYAPANIFAAQRILGSELQNDTANNSINAMKSLGSIPEHFHNPYLTNSDAWFVRTDIGSDDGLICFDSIPFEIQMDNDSDTLNEKHIAFEGYSFTIGDPRAVWGTPGV